MAAIICGLVPSSNLRARDDYPLVKATCNYNIVDVYTVTDLVQEYQSKPTNAEQSISYVFPLPPSAAVCSFKAVIDGTKVINGNVMEKRKAKEVYDAAITQGKQAGLLEKGSVDSECFSSQSWLLLTQNECSSIPHFSWKHQTFTNCFCSVCILNHHDRNA
jgi:hypothetical protein